jgi:hypothetical protein
MKPLGCIMSVIFIERERKREIGMEVKERSSLVTVVVVAELRAIRKYVTF